MAKHTPPTLYPAPIAPGRFGLSGHVPNPQSWRRIASGFNFAAARCRKLLELYAYGNDGTGQEHPIAAISPFTGRSSTFLFRTGPAVDHIELVAAVAPPEATGGGSGAVLQVTDAGGTAVLSDPILYTHGPVAEWAPDDVHWGVARLSGLSPNTLYQGAVGFGLDTRVQGAAVYEVAGAVLDDADDGICDPTPFSVHGDIEAAAVQGVVEAGAELWRHGGAQLFSWSSRDGVAVRDDDFAGGSQMRNLLDGSRQPVSATDVGFYVDTSRAGSRMRDIGVEIAVYAEVVSGTSDLVVRLINDADAIVASFQVPAGSGDPFYVEKTTISAADDKLRVYVGVQGLSGEGDEWNVYAVGAWLYDG